MTTIATSGVLTDADYWDDVYRNGRRPYTFPDVGGNRFHVTLARLLQRHVRPGMAALELGCGGSLWLPYLAKVHGCEVSGLDFSAEGIKKARLHLEANDVTGRLCRADFMAPPEEFLGRFDLVYSLGVVEHFDDPAAVIAAFTRYLKPSGRVLTWIPNTAGWIMRLQRWADREIYDRHCVMTLDDLLRAHRAAGLSLREAAYARFLDLSMVNVYRWPIGSYRRWMSLARAVNAPLGWLERVWGLPMPSKRFGASSYVVAERRDALCAG